MRPPFFNGRQHSPKNFELHEGFIFAFAGGTAAHDQIAFNVRLLLVSAFPSPCRAFGSDMKVLISPKTYYYPDVTVTCEPISDDATVIQSPRVAVEVLSHTTRAYDLVEKRSAYRSLPSLDAYIIVHSESRRVEVDRRHLGGSWRTETYDAMPVPLGEGELSLDAIYRSTTVADSGSHDS